MTVTTTANFISYAGNGTTTAFAFPYIFFEPSDLVVVLFDTATNLFVEPAPVLGGGGTYGYTLSGVVDSGEYPAGATITFNTAPAAGLTVTINRVVPALQEVTLIDNTKFPADTINVEFDKLTVLAQQSAYYSQIALRIPVGEANNVTAPAAALRANHLMAWESNADVGISNKTLGEIEGAVDIVWNGIGAIDVGQAIVLDSLGALQGLTSTPPLAITKGRVTPGDGGGGVWTWVATDMTAAVTADPGSGLYAAPFSDPTGASGAWWRLWQGSTVWAEWFGAAGDNVTDDTVAINNLNTACHAFHLVLGFVSGKTYRYTGPLNIATTVGGIDGNGAWLRSIGASTHCIAFGQGNFEQAKFNLPNIIDYTGGAGVRLLGTANLDCYVHSIYGGYAGIMSETTQAIPATINNRVRFMKIGQCQAGIHIKAGADAVAGHQSQQGLTLEGNFINGCLKGVFCDFAGATNQTSGINDIVIRADGIDGNQNYAYLFGNTHGTTTIDGIADTSIFPASAHIAGPGVDVGTTYTVAGPNSITLSAAAYITGTGLAFVIGESIGFHCPVGIMNGPWLLECSEFVGGNAQGDIIIPDGANGMDFICGWPASPPYGAIRAVGSTTIRNTFQQGSVMGAPIDCSTTSNNRAGFNGGHPMGYNRLWLRMPLNPAGVTAGTDVTAYAYSPFLNGFDTKVTVTPLFHLPFAVTTVWDSSIATAPDGTQVAYQIMIRFHCLADSIPALTGLTFLLQVGD